jgi:hypothetical protein
VDLDRDRKGWIWTGIGKGGFGQGRVDMDREGWIWMDMDGDRIYIIHHANYVF